MADFCLILFYNIHERMKKTRSRHIFLHFATHLRDAKKNSHELLMFS